MNRIQEKAIYIFKKFIDVCKRHRLNWFVDGGTLLAAVRDGKFIPWDDDVDVAMPREDFNRFSHLMHFKYNDRLDDVFFQDPISDPEYFNIHARLRLDGTSAISEREKNINSHKGLFIDIYPIDAVPNDEQAYKDVEGFMRSLIKINSVDIKDKALYYISPTLAYHVMTTTLTNVTLQNEDSTYVALLVFSRYTKYRGCKMTRHAYSSTITMKFEDIDVNVPIGYDEILRLWYGDDYITPRQEESFHNVEIKV